MRVEAEVPVVFELLGVVPVSRWRLDPARDTLETGPATRPLPSYVGQPPGALRDLVVGTAQASLQTLLRRAEESWVRWALRHDEASARDAALGVLRSGREPAPFAQALFDLLVAEPRNRPAARVFKKVGPAAGPVLAAAIEDSDATRRDRALEWIPSLRGDAKAAIPAVAALLDERDAVPPLALLRVITDVGRDAATATEALCRFARERCEHYELALDALASIGPAAKAAVPDLVAIARARPGYGHGRLRATLALASIDPDHRELPGFVVLCLEDPNDNVIELACLHVGGWSKPAAAIRKALRSAAKHRSARVRAAAREALARLGEKQ